MNMWTLITQLIDMRSFSTLWYWVVLAVYWSLSSHWVLGVPHDMIHRAHRIGGEAVKDLECLVRINTQRMLYYSREAYLPLIGTTAFIFTTLVLLGFVYDIEFAQAVLFIFVPAIIQGLLGIRASRLIERGEGEGDALFRRLFRHRVTTQTLGIFCLFITGLYGMYRDFSVLMPS